MPAAALITVVTITYNNHIGLLATAQSLAAQKFKQFEWVIIDGDSKDQTKEILSHLTPTPATIIIEPDNGIYDAMNKGVTHANGLYTLFLNAGDTLPFAETLGHIAKELTVNRPDFLYGDAFEFTTNGNHHFKAARRHEKQAWGLFTHHQSMLYKTALLKSFQYNTRYKIAADYDLTLRFLRSAQTITYLAAPLSVFEAGGLSQTQALSGRAEQFTIRRTLKTVPLWKNIVIYAAQWLNWHFRKITPNAYWFLKRSSQSGDNKDSGSAPIYTPPRHPESPASRHKNG